MISKLKSPTGSKITLSVSDFPNCTEVEIIVFVKKFYPEETFFFYLVSFYLGLSKNHMQNVLHLTHYFEGFH